MFSSYNQLLYWVVVFIKWWTWMSESNHLAQSIQYMLIKTQNHKCQPHNNQEEKSGGYLEALDIATKVHSNSHGKYKLSRKVKVNRPCRQPHWGGKGRFDRKRFLHWANLVLKQHQFIITTITNIHPNFIKSQRGREEDIAFISYLLASDAGALVMSFWDGSPVPWQLL